MHRGGEEAQVLGDDGPIPQGLLEDVEKGDARPGTPTAPAGVFVPGGDGIVGVKAPEVVNAQHIVDGELEGHPAHPPLVAVFHHALPVEEGVAPQLSVLGEAVGGTPGHLGGAQVLVQLELLGIGPHVGAVRGHIDGQVSDDGDALAVGVLFQRFPLGKEEELYPLPEENGVGQLAR